MRKLLILLLIGLPSCSGCKKTVPDNALNDYIAGTQAVGRVVELIASVSPGLSDTFRQGDTVPISYVPAADGAEPDSVVLYVRGRRMGRMQNGVWDYGTEADRPLGRVPYRIAAYQGRDSVVRVGEFTVMAAKAPDLYGYRVVKSHPHDAGAYTQGLFWHDGFLYESTGLKGESTLRRVDLSSGEVLQSISLDAKYFGEGAAILGGKIYQLTWEEQTGFIYDAGSFEKVGEFGYTGAGWGLTTDGQYLYMSNGSEKILVLDPQTLRPIRTIEVYTDQDRVIYLNELEWIDGEIWANVYTTDRIVRIDPATGVVKGIIDLKRLLPSADKDLSTDVLNGIAHDPATGRIFVTGKRWKKLFEIALLEQ